MAKNNLRAWAAAVALIQTLGACSAEVEENDGSCKLQCDAPKVPSIDFVIEPLFELGSWTCRGAPGAVIQGGGPLMVAFRISEKLKATSSGQTEGTLSTDLSERLIPRGNIGFQPLVGGPMWTERTHDSLKKDGVPTPARFGGVVTDPVEWCSDSCGVMRYEVWPACVVPSETEITLGVSAGAIKAEILSMKVTGEDSSEDDTKTDTQTDTKTDTQTN